MACTHLHAMLRPPWLKSAPARVCTSKQGSSHIQPLLEPFERHSVVGFQAGAGRGPRRSRLLQLAAVAALLFAAVRAITWLRGTQSVDIRDLGNGQPGLGGMGIDMVSMTIGNSADTATAAPAKAAASSGVPMPAVDLAACMAEDNATAALPMTTDMYLSGDPTRCVLVNR